MDLSETGSWTYQKPVCGPIRNRFVDLWPVRGPIGNQFVDLSETGSCLASKGVVRLSEVGLNTPFGAGHEPVSDRSTNRFPIGPQTGFR